MDAPEFTLETFSPGDLAVFERSFSLEDYKAFAALSGDENPLHHDTAYCSQTPYGRPVVPLHMTLAPLSMVAGMVFPGEPSLYLGHDVRVAKTVHYGENLRYSALVSSVHPAQGVLALRVLAIRGPEVVLEATMRVRARNARWRTPPAIPVRNVNTPGTAVITGGTGEIGSEIALALARQGWRLLIADRGKVEARRALDARLGRVKKEADYLAADLDTQEGRSTLADAVADLDNLGVIVHASSPQVDAPAETLASVNFTALKQMVESGLPALLERQRASVVFISSSATLNTPEGWEDYAATKSMAASYVDGLDRRYAHVGLRGLNIVPGFVATGFSRRSRGDAPAIMPGEVAEAVAAAIATPGSPGNTILMEPGRVKRGAVAFVRQDAPSPDIPSRAAPVEADVAGGSPVAETLRQSLRLPADADVSRTALGVTSGWDSLKHIEIMLEIEKRLGVAFTAAEVQDTHDFERLDALCRSKLGGKE